LLSSLLFCTRQALAACIEKRRTAGSGGHSCQFSSFQFSGSLRIWCRNDIFSPGSR
jgi:hypothetical protein